MALNVGVAGTPFTYGSNGSGGVNYYGTGGQPVTREQFATGTGLDPGTIEYHYAQPGYNAPQSQAQTPATTPTGSTSGGGGSGINQGEYLQGIEQQYGSAINSAQNQLGELPDYYNQQQGDIAGQAGAQVNTAKQQASSALNTLNTQRQGVEAQRGLSLSQLADQIRGQHGALQNQLGSVGAGFSSAADQGDYALAREQNAGRAGVQTQANVGLGQIGANEQATQETLKTQLDTIEQWKQAQLHTIAHNYFTQLNQLQQALGTAQGEEKARLAIYGQSLNQAASSALQNLDQVTTNAIKGLSQGLAAAPKVNPLPDYKAPDPVQVATVSPFVPAAGAGNATSLAGGGIPLKNQQQ